MGLGSMGLGSMGLGSMGLGSMGLGSMGLGSMGLGSIYSAKPRLPFDMVFIPVPKDASAYQVIDR